MRPQRSKLTLQSQIIWLPKTDEQYAVSIKPGWGTVDGSIQLQNGWMLTTLGSKTDSKVPETISAMSGLITNIAKAAVPGAKAVVPGGGEVNVLKPGLYRIEFSSDGYVSKLVLVPMGAE